MKNTGNEKKAVSSGIEPESWVPETQILSVVLRDRLMGQI
jgi:hypothetical protein